MRLIAPVLSFTADEVWQTVAPGVDASVFEQEWHRLPESGLDQIVVDQWGNIRQLRDIVNKRLEERRASGDIGSP